MLDMEEGWMMKDLRKEGMSISAISRETGHDRKTVRKRILSNELPAYKEREAKDSILEPYKDYIRQRVLKYDIAGTRILREIEEKGYKGGYSTVKRFIRPLREERAVIAVYRYETKPGVQAQVDWIDLGYTEEDGISKKVYGFAMTLGYSRMRSIEFTTDTSTETLIRCHIDAFTYYGGNTDEVLYDNIKQVVQKRAMKYDDNKWNPMFEDFFKHYDFKPRLCRPYRAQTKGKIENTVKLVRNDFYKGLEYNSIADLNAKGTIWCNELNRRVHRTTNAIPAERLSEEKLHSINDKPPYQIVRIEYRKISSDCYVSYLGNRYSVPWKQAGRTARLSIKDGKMTVEINGETICVHEVRPGTGSIVRVKEHFTGLLEMIRGKNIRTHLQRNMKLPGIPDVERRPLSTYDAILDPRGRVDG